MPSMTYTAIPSAVLLALCAGAFDAGAADSGQVQEVLIEHGYVMTMEPGQQDLRDTDVLLRDGRIVAIGKGLKAEGAQRIDATGMVVMPGFVDAHSHLWVTTMRGQFRNAQGKFFPVSKKLAAVMDPDDTYTAMYSGALELLQSGITTTADFFDNIHGPAWGDAGLRALDDAGVRAVMYYGGPDKTTRHPIDTAHLAALAAQPRRSNESARVRLGLGWRLPRDRSDAANWAVRQDEYNAARKAGLPIQVHVSGEARPMFDALIQRQYLAPSLTVVHATDATPAQLDALEQAGGSVALTPLSEQRVGYGLTRVDHFATVTRRGLGIDGNSLAGSADMFANLRLAALTWSGQATDETAPAPRALLEMATRGGAMAVGLGEQTGTLAQGKRADLQLINLKALNFSGYGGGDPAALLLYSARPENVDTVIVDGRVLKRGGQLVGVDTAQVLQRAAASAEAMLARAAKASAAMD